jgi:hypothetical protein
MPASTVSLPLTLATALLAAGASADPVMVLQMNLKDLAARADKIYRGTVVGIDRTTVRVGGGELPAVVYRLRVGEVFKGEIDAGGREPVIELKMVSQAKVAGRSGSKRSASVLPEMPGLDMGQDYVLFTTRPSSVGLSTTVGLGQGAFTITGSGKDEAAVNAENNLGLGRDLRQSGLPTRGPVSYAQLAQAIRSVLSE